MRWQIVTLCLACCLPNTPGAIAQVSFLSAIREPRVLAPKELTPPVTIPAGTHFVLRLTSPVHTTSATPGAGVYLETELPVIAGHQVIIPEHTRVQGVVEHARRPGRVRGRARLRMRFTEFILPDNRVYEIAARLQSLPGSASERSVDQEGTLEPVDQLDEDVYLIAGSSGIGVLFGSIRHAGIGVGRGAAIGAGLGLAKVLFTRGDDISLPVGTRVEMVLQQPLAMEVHHE